MNHNKIYFIQTAEAETHKNRHCWLISSPSEEEAQYYLPAAGWVDIEAEIILHSEQVEGLVDTDESMDGQTYIKMHN